MEFVLPGKWKCHTDDCPAGLLVCTVSKLIDIEGGLTGQGTAGGESVSPVGTTAATSTNLGVS